jgi:hypothetical protein
MHRLLISASLGLALAGCAGNAMAPVPTVPSGPSSGTAGPAISAAPDVRTNSTRTAATSIGALNSIGGAITALAEENASESPSKTPKGGGVCRNGVEFYAPDRAGDPNSTETEFFYSPSCSQLARDAVRRFTPSGSNAETVDLTIANYAPGGSTPLSTRTSTVQFSNATFTGYGWPVVAGGFVREAQSTLDAGHRTIDGDNEFIVTPANNNVSAFCSDWAGYNATGIARLNATFGWSGGFLSGGTRTINGDGSVTWTGTRNATLYEGAIGSLSIVPGTTNSACPIATPAYAIGGGTAKGSSVGTLTVTFDNGWMQSLSVSRTSLSGGYSLTASSNAGVWPTSSNFITGTVSRAGTTVATFSVNAAGDGTLAVTATGARYYVAGWTVVR